MPSNFAIPPMKNRSFCSLAGKLTAMVGQILAESTGADHRGKGVEYICIYIYTLYTYIHIESIHFRIHIACISSKYSPRFMMIIIVHFRIEWQFYCRINIDSPWSVESCCHNISWNTESWFHDSVRLISSNPSIYPWSRYEFGNHTVDGRNIASPWMFKPL